METKNLNTNQISTNQINIDKSTNDNRVVLSCIDGSSVSKAVCDYSSWIAKKVSAPLKLLHAIEHSHNPAVSDFTGAIGLGSQEDLLNELTELEQNRGRLLIKKGQLMLNGAKERVCMAGVEFPELCQRHGSLAETLIELEEDIRVLVMGIRGEAHEQEFMGIGTQLETVIRSLHRPILVVNTDFTEPENIMLAYDGSEACRKALGMVASSPLFKDITCHIVHVGDKGKDLLEEASAILIKADLDVISAQLSGSTEEVLAQYQTEKHIDLMIMGAFSHNRVRDFLLGSFTAKMLTTTQRPLLLLR